MKSRVVQLRPAAGEATDLDAARARAPARAAYQGRGRGRARLAFTLLGGFSVTRGSWLADDSAWERRVAQRLVRYLLLHRAGPVSEDEILDVFWTDTDAAPARRSLRVATSRARAVLDLSGPPSVIEVRDRMYRLRLRPDDTVDADCFEAAARAALAALGDARLLEEAAACGAASRCPRSATPTGRSAGAHA